MKASEYFSLPESLALFANHFSPDAAPWEWLKKIKGALESIEYFAPVPAHALGVHIEGPVFIHPSVKLPHFATIIGPAYIGPNTEIRPGAFIRGNVIVGAGCVLGNASEFKNCLLLDGVQAPHYNYVGDSVLGNKSHMGAGSICSNLRLDQGEVIVRTAEKNIPTGLRKFGAILGDQAEVGCNAVLNPGTIMGKRSLVMPTLAFSGCLPADTIARARVSITTMPRRA